jgi:23S rRNA (adenine2030-N6)-methyltransferase
VNHHFGELGDVWKHLPLAEILRLNPPRHYWETHAGSAAYPLTRSPARRHGALRFLEHAPNDPSLQNCAYLHALQEMPGLYPGSPQLAMRALGREASYLFCDIDPESAASLQTAVTGYQASIFEADGVSAIYRQAEMARLDPAEVLVHIDPFDPRGRFTPGSKTPLELAAWLAGSGYRVFFWYCYDTADLRGWALDEIAALASGFEMWCGDVLMPASFIYPDRSGAWGCGILLANATGGEAAACEQLGRALERINADDLHRGNDPDRLTFRVIH